MSNQETSEKFETVCKEIINRLVTQDIERDDLEELKREVCKKYEANKVPKNGEILSRVPSEYEDELKSILQRKPVRTASGVSPVAIMTSPHMCPHGKCLYCPGGPASEFDDSAQAYTGDEPASRRAQQNDYDPYGQVTLRLNQLQYIGHPVDKIDLILMGGTMTARSHDYQEWFVKRALEAMNDYDVDSKPDPSNVEDFSQNPDEYDFKYLEDVIAENENSDVRCIGTTFETKPDWCEHEQVDRMLRLGGTKVEIGVQTTYNQINRDMHRGHGTQASVNANKWLRDSGFKIGFHMMPGQPGMTKEMCVNDFERIFDNPKWRPDYLKIYPTLVVKGTRVYDMWRRDDFEPLDNEDATEVVAKAMSKIPKYVRLTRVQRDIPADNIEGGVWKSNLRQLAQQRLENKGWSCDDIRGREVGMSDTQPSSVELNDMVYESAGGTEHFISVDGVDQEALIGFCRLRFPGDPHRPELQDAAIVRELHVYGNEVSIGNENGESWQHRGFGRELMEKAERTARDAGYNKLAVISGIGAREYYTEKLGYERDGPYVSKIL
jgi:elongator complex protein 3